MNMARRTLLVLCMGLPLCLAAAVQDIAAAGERRWEREDREERQGREERGHRRRPRLVSITIRPGHVTLDLGEHKQFRAYAHYRDGSSKEITRRARWFSSHWWVGRIDRHGRLTARRKGQTWVWAKWKGKWSNVSEAEVKKTPVGIDIRPRSVALNVNDQRQFRAFAQYRDGSSQDVTRQATWSSSDRHVGDVNEHGLFTATAAGQTQVRARWQGKRSEAARVMVMPDTSDTLSGTWNGTWTVADSDRASTAHGRMTLDLTGSPDAFMSDGSVDTFLLSGTLSMSGIPEVRQLSIGVMVSSGHVTGGTRSDNRRVTEQFFVLTQAADCNLILFANDATSGHGISASQLAGDFIVDCIGLEGDFVMRQ